MHSQPHPLRPRSRRRHLRRASLSVLVLAAAALPALAGDAPLVGGDPLPAQRVEALLALQGYGRVLELRRRGGVWVGEAIERSGRHVRVVVDAGTGELSGLRPVGPWPSNPSDMKSRD